MRIKMNFNSHCFQLLRACYSTRKWSVPKELLSSSVNKEVRQSKQTKMMKTILLNKFPKAEKIVVTDLSGNCGSMYEVIVVSSEFEGLPLVKQHMLVTEALSQEIKSMHGIRIETEVPKSNQKSST